MPKQIDVIIPVYNEADNLVSLVGRLDSSFHKANIKYQLLFVDDHSTDKSVRILTTLKKRYPITILTKKGNQGKAFSILEAAQVSTAPYLAMIDADLQYPPEIIPEMLKVAKTGAVVVAKRNDYQETKVRHVLSRGFKWFFGKVLHGLNCDVQSGLKVFPKEVIQRLSIDDVTPWTLDIPLLTTALQLGLPIKEIDITFEKRTKGESKVKLLTSIREIGGQAVSYKLKKRSNLQIAPDVEETMLGAGMYHKGKPFITHTTLTSDDSAVNVLTRPQKGVFVFIAAFLLGSLFLDFVGTLKILVGILSFVYFADVFFNLFVVLKSLKKPPEIQIDPKKIADLNDKDLPMYTVMCPLYKEAHVLPQFVEAISKMDWPKNKLDVILLLEQDDQFTIDAAKKMNLPSYVTVQVVPDSQPKTKPKACNYGLHFAKGKYLVIYDAEDVPDPLQLKKVYLAFLNSPDSVKCIQAKLNFYNPHQNLLTRFFTAEYSLWFDVVLTGLQSIETSIPLGGTSNHFRTQDLKDLEGWDSFNVTEDADLGIRLFKRGALTAIIDSITLEEANSSWTNWLRQRSRWIKGYMQTYLVHMRNPYKFFKEYGWHALLFQLVMGGKIAFMLINPFMWLLTISYFGLYAIVGPTIETFYPSIIFYMAVTSLIFGNFLFIYYYMIGAAKREHWTIIKWIFLVPIYWLLVSVAAGIALYQLIVKPHYWEKTVHGLDKMKKKDIPKEEVIVMKPPVTTDLPDPMSEPAPATVMAASISRPSLKSRIATLSSNTKSRVKKKPVQNGFLFVIALIVGNVLNFASTLFLGSQLKVVDFGYMNMFISLFYISSLITAAFSSTVNYKVAFLFGRYRDSSGYEFWNWMKKKTFSGSLLVSGVWLASIPFLTKYFHTPTALPFIIFTPLILITALIAVDSGLLKGKLAFHLLAVLMLVEPIVRLFLTFILEQLHQTNYLYLAIPISLLFTFILAHIFATRYFKEERKKPDKRIHFTFPTQFFTLALAGSLAGITFFSLDNILTNHFLSPQDAGKYALLGVFGKVIFFVGSLTSGFVLPIVSRNEGRNVSSKKIYYFLLTATSIMTAATYVVLTLGLKIVSPFFDHEKILAIAPYFPLYGLGVLCFTISQNFISYHLAKKQYAFPFTAFMIMLLEVAFIALGRHTLGSVVTTMSAVGILNIILLGLLHVLYQKFEVQFVNVSHFLDLLFGPLNSFRMSKIQEDEKKARILIFNWRDTKHSWAGGSESYIHETAKNLVKKGHTVTVFCGNDGHSSHNDTVDGIFIIRRGGFYTVYFWAFLYYAFKLRKKTDIIIDSENGIPFLTPLYSKKPILLLIHHVHQDVFREHLSLPLATIAVLIETKIMPLIYKNKKVITVSESSKKEILSLGLTGRNNVEVINPGINTDLFGTSKKTAEPSMVYVGRLKEYKNLDVALLAFKDVLKEFPRAHFTIAGEGEMKAELLNLAKELGISKNITLTGKVSDSKKKSLLSESWIAIQPSMIEGWGITVIEANACGTPVIASNVKGLRDSVLHEETGILVEPNNVKLFTSAISKTLKNKKYRESLSTSALKWARNFSWEKSAEVLSQTIDEELEDSPDYVLAVESVKL